MRLPLSARQVVRVTPEEGGPTYLLAVPTVLGVNELSSRLVESGVLRVTIDELQQMMLDLLPTVVQGPDYDRAVSLITQVLNGTPAEGVDQVFLRAIEQRIVRENPSYARLVAEQNRWWPRYQWLAVKMFWRGTESPEQSSKTWTDEAPDDELSDLPRDHFNRLASEIVDMVFLSTGSKKSSDSASLLATEQTNSPEVESHQTVAPGT